MKVRIVKKSKPIEELLIWKASVHVQRAILAFASMAAVVCVCGTAIARYVFQRDLFGIEEVITLLAMWIYWIGGVYRSYEKSHITADMFSVMMKTDKARFRLDVVVNVLTVMISAVFAYWSIVDYFVWNVQANTVTTGLHIPYLASNIAITISFAMMFLYFLYHLIRLFIPRNETMGAGEEAEK